MPRLAKDEVRKKIRRAVVAETAASGIGALSVGKIVKRAGISAGTVYLHFSSKEDMLQQVYMEIKSEFHALMVAAKSEADSAAMLKRMWFDTFGFIKEFSEDFLFIEYAGAAQILNAEQQQQTQTMQQEIIAMLQGAVDNGTLAPIPVSTISVLFIAPAMQLARSAVLNEKEVDLEAAELTFNRVWLAIAAD